MTCFRRILIIFLAGVLAMPSTSLAEAKAKTLTSADRIEIAETVAGVGLYADVHDWTRLEALLAPEVTTDYTSLFGGQVATSSREALIAQWRGLLPGFDATQHLITNVVIEMSGDDVLVRSHVRATHWIGARSWTVGGTYTHRLARSGSGWRVRSLTLRRLYEKGDRELVEEASARLKVNPAR